MSARSSIVNKLADTLKCIDGTGTYNSNLYGNVQPKLRFWDEVNDFPFVCVSAGSEVREYQGSAFKWGFLTVAIKVYVKDEDDPISVLEDVFSDIEVVLDANNTLEYEPNKTTEDIRIVSIESDEGLLAPLGIGEITIQIRYEVLP
jgi:hypothetical protein